MKKEHEIILTALKQYLESYPNIRFGQALFNLNINQFVNPDPVGGNYDLRDIHSDTDKQIVARLTR